MCSYERAGWLGCRDLGFINRGLGNRAGNVSHMNTSARLAGWFFFFQPATHASWGRAASDSVVKQSTKMSKFLIWTYDKIRPGNRAGLIWRGPYRVSRHATYCSLKRTWMWWNSRNSNDPKAFLTVMWYSWRVSIPMDIKANVTDWLTSRATRGKVYLKSCILRPPDYCLFITYVHIV